VEIAASETPANGESETESRCPFSQLAGSAPGPELKKAVGTYLNEVGLMSAMAEKKAKAEASEDPEEIN